MATLTRLIKNRKRFSKGCLDGYTTNELGICFMLRDTSCLPEFWRTKQCKKLANGKLLVLPKTDNTALIQIVAD